MLNKNKKISSWLIVAIMIIMLVAIWILLLFSGGGANNFYGRINYRPLPIPASTVKKNPPLGLEDLGAVETWMTFDYLNRAFNLPADYLRAGLKIEDARYPRLSLNRYARTKNLDAAVVAGQVRQAIADYLMRK